MRRLSAAAAGVEREEKNAEVGAEVYDEDGMYDEESGEDDDCGDEGDASSLFLSSSALLLSTLAEKGRWVGRDEGVPLEAEDGDTWLA